MTVNPSISREAARAAMARTETSQKAFALSAGIPESTVADALNQRGRNFDADWPLAQSPEFVAVYYAELGTRLGLTVNQQHRIRAARIAELVQLLCEGVA